MGEITAAGEAITGALLGRAVEPKAGEGHGEHDHGALCLNCGTALIGPHCHECGQAGHVHRSLGAIGHEILHGVAHFEGKIWRTLPMLITRPGELTRRYIAGERARFVSPLAMFLFMVFLMFAVIHAVGGEFEAPKHTHEERVQSVAELDKQIAGIQAQMDEIEKERAAGGDPQELRIRKMSLEPALAGLRAGRAEAAAGAKAKDGDDKFVSTKIDTGWAKLNHGIEKINENPNLALYKLQSNSYKFSWLLIPLSLPFMWLLFAWKREYHLYDHAVFVTYSIAFMSLLFITLLVAGEIGVSGWIITWAALLIPPFHMYRQLRGAYRLGRGSALVRLLLLLFATGIVLLLFLACIIGMGVLG